MPETYERALAVGGGTFPFNLGNGYALQRPGMRFEYEGELHKHRGLLKAGVRLERTKRARTAPQQQFFLIYRLTLWQWHCC